MNEMKNFEFLVRSDGSVEMLSVANGWVTSEWYHAFQDGYIFYIGAESEEQARVKLDRMAILWVGLLFACGFLGVSQSIQLTADTDASAESAKLQNILRGLIHSESGAAPEPRSPIPLFFGLHPLSDIESLLALKTRGEVGTGIPACPWGASQE